jgi:hypothetical protein
MTVIMLIIQYFIYVRWLMNYATSREVAGSIPGQAITVSHCGPRVYSTSNRNEYQEFSCGVKGGRLARKADNLTTICEQIV